MNISTFFKILNRKIERYDIMAPKNPFEIPQPVIFIWIEDCIDNNPSQAENN